MAKLTWQSKNVIEMYVKDCCTSSADTHAVVKEFKESKLLISKISKQIGSSLLLRIDKNQIYEGGVFESRQKDHRTLIRSQFASSFQTVLTILRNMFKHFKDGSAEVQREWKSQINQVHIYIYIYINIYIYMYVYIYIYIYIYLYVYIFIDI
jgi:hypothetical protein